MCNESKLEVVLLCGDREGDRVLRGSGSVSKHSEEYVSKQKLLTVM